MTFVATTDGAVSSRTVRMAGESPERARGNTEVLAEAGMRKGRAVPSAVQVFNHSERLPDLGSGSRGADGAPYISGPRNFLTHLFPFVV